MQAIDERNLSRFNSAAHTLDIPAGETVHLDAVGQFFYLLEASTKVKIKIPGMGEMPHNAGTGQRAQEGGYFDRLEIHNPSTSTATITIFVGVESGYIDNRLNVIASRQPMNVFDQPTRVKASETTEIPANDELTFPGDFTATDYHRKALVVANMNQELNLHIADADGNVLLPVFPGTSVLFPSSSSLKVVNPNGTAVSSFVSEIIYVKISE